MTSTFAENRTNVRLSIAGLVLATAMLGACAAPPRIAAQRDDCGIDRQNVCATFGPAQSCSCQPRTQVARFLATLGEPAWLGATR